MNDERQLSLLAPAPEDEDESWEARWASLPRIPGDPPPEPDVPEERKAA